MNVSELSGYFFIQMFVILAACRIVGWFAQKCGQPQVIGEMIAGILLGPSLFGYVMPSVQSMLFPPETLKTLYVVAQFGIGLYMFLVGTEFQTSMFRTRFKGAICVSAFGMLVPCAMAFLITPWLLDVPGLFSPKLQSHDAMMFMGASLSITAFPMLARMINEHGLSGTPLGTLALAAGSIDDATAWCMLAVILGSFSGSSNMAIHAIVGGVIYASLLLSIGSWVFQRIGTYVEKQGSISHGILSLILMLLMIGAWIMDTIGLHAVFGGFILGVAMPRGEITRALKHHIEPLAVVFFLPAFFTFSGLNTRLDLVNDISMLHVTLAVILVACIGKLGACWLAARLSGEDNYTALSIGALMNARGLMELMIINIGLQKRMIEPALFSIMVLMTVATTLMASPLFLRFYVKR